MRAVLAGLAVVLVLATVPAAACAHPMSTLAVLLDIGSGEVGGEVQLPLDRLAVALDRELTPAAGRQRAGLERYTRAHIHAVGADGRRWSVAVGRARVERVDAVDRLVMPLTLTPPGGDVTDFTLGYDVIIEQLVTHKAVVTVRSH